MRERLLPGKAASADAAGSPPLRFKGTEFAQADIIGA
jgi:hypothetical protein